MVASVNLKTDLDQAEAILELWDIFGEFEAAPSMRPLGYPPHFTFAIYDRIETDLVARSFEEVFADRSTFEIEFREIRWFDADPFVVWLAPHDDTQLRAIHDALHARIDPHHCRSYYRPDAWVPHCTLAMNIPPDRVEAAKQCALAKLPNLRIKFDIADWITAPPLQVAQETRLTGGWPD